MSGISGISFNQSISCQAQLKNSNFGASNVNFQGGSEKPEKKNSHKLLKALVVAGIAIGGYFLFKKHGKEISTKTKEFIDKIGQKSKEIIEGFKGSKNAAEQGTKVAAEEAKAAAEAISKPFTTSAEQINKNLGIKDAVKSAADSATVFEANGLTDIEKKLNLAESVSAAKQQAKTRPTITFTEADVVAPAPKLQVKLQSESSSTGFLGDATVAPAPKTKSQPRPTISFVEDDVVAAPVTQPKVKKAKKDLVPSKREVIREHTSFSPGERTQSKGRAASKKARHNKKQIIQELLNRA